MKAGTRIKAKKRCCKDKPRCKKCPVVCKRMVVAGLAERVSKREVVLVDVVGKAQLRALRARG